MLEVTRLLNAVEKGDPKAAEDLLPLVYEELRRLAAYKMAQEPPGQTLQATALVHEAWLRLGRESGANWQNRRHFFHVAAEAMRRILVDRARRRRAAKHGGQWHRVELEGLEVPEAPDDSLVLRVHEAFDQFAGEDPEAAAIVRLRFFVGLSSPETAEVLGLSESTVRRHWIYAKSRLVQIFRELE